MSSIDSTKCILHYLFQTDENGLRCSLDSVHTQDETFELSIANTRGSSVYLKSIKITFPLGADAANTLSGSNNITYTISPSNTYKVTQQSPGVFFITATDGKLINFLNQGIYMRFSGIVMNTTLGVMKIKVDETSSFKSNGADMTTNTNWIWFGKYPYQFYMHSLAVDKATVAVGESVTLSWVGAYNGNYTLYWNDALGQQSQDVTNVRVWQSPPLQQATVFVLQGISVDGDRRTVQLERGVMVRNPAITTSALTVTDGMAQINFAGDNLSYSNDGALTTTAVLDGTRFCRQQFQATLAGPLGYLEVYCDSAASSPCTVATSIEVTAGHQTGLSGYNGEMQVTPGQWCRFGFGEYSLVAGNTYTVGFSVGGNTTVTLGANAAITATNFMTTDPAHNLLLRVHCAAAHTGGLVVNAAGGVGIGTATPSYPLDVLGTVQAQAFVEASDLSLKRNVETLPDALAQLLQLRGVRYQRHDAAHEEIGFIAQEVEAVYPALVHQDPNGLGAVAYSRITAVLVEALKTLSDEVTSLKAELKQLKDK